ncbi:hypothetical protein ABZ890_45700 [Streptomyces sp. NPDC046984]|uniref:hypothetical protein n=1 Tax=Streptomyces sp. NPDC046984 TaxID=3155138 RepID=UPI0033F8901A
MIDKAFQTLVSRCMRRFDLRYEKTAGEDGDPTGIGADAPKTRMDGYFGFQTMAHAAHWGYHPEGGMPSAGAGVAPQYSKNEVIVLTGATDPDANTGSGGQVINSEKVPDRGCVGEAKRLISGSASGNIGDDKFAVDLKFDTIVRGQGNPQTVAVFSKWSKCMETKGFRYADPLKAAGDGWNKAPSPTPREIHVAIADQECRRTHNVVGV